MSEVDLNRLRQAVKQAQSANQKYANDAARQPMVKRDGSIVFADQVSTSDQSQVTRIPMGTFASSDRRLQAERAFAAAKMPANTEELTVDGITGWLFGILSEFQNRYEFFAYFSEGVYKVKVVTPEGVEHRHGVHDAHIFNDGTICFGGDVNLKGLPTLEEAFAKSVLWAHGFDTIESTGRFQFSINNK